MARSVDTTTGHDAVLTLARQRFTLVSEAESEQRTRERDDLRFDAGEQWPDDVKAARGGQVVDGVPIPARPMLTVSRLDQPVQLVINQARSAHLGIQVHADSDTATEATAEVLQGLIRHIEVRSQASLARDWAFERAVKCGRGFYRVLTQEIEDSGETFDQEIVVERILNQAGVYLDPYAQKPDWSDAEWAFVGGFVPAAQFKREYPNASATANMDDAFMGVGDEAPEWMGEDNNGQPTVRVMEYFVIERTQAERVAYRDAQGGLASAWGDEVPESVPSAAIETREPSERRRVRWYKITGTEVLAEQVWPGRYIPIIPVIGREQNIDGVRRWIGVINPAKDAQRLFNYAVSTAVETVALEPKAPYIGYEGQFEGHEESWAQANTRNFPYLQVKPTTIGGQPAPMPQRQVAGAQLGPSIALIQQAAEYVKATTFVYDPSLGDSSGSRSGRAVMALQQQSDAGNSNYLDNLAQTSMVFEAKVLLDLIPHIYDRPGRITRILGTDDTATKVMLNAPFVPGPDGTPQPAPMGMPPGMPGMPPGMMPGQMRGPMRGPRRPPSEPTKHDLQAGRYGVTVTVGKSWQSRSAQGADEMAQVLQSSPALMPIIGDLFFKYRDFPGHEEIAERLKKMLPPNLQAGDDEEGGAPSPEVLAAQQQVQQVQQQAGQMIEQLTQQLQQMQQQMQQQAQAMEADQSMQQMKLQADQSLQQMKMQADLQRAEMDAQTKLQIAERQIDTEWRIAQLRAETTLRETVTKGQTAVTLQDDAQAHAVGMAGHAAALQMTSAAMAPEPFEDDENELPDEPGYGV